MEVACWSIGQDNFLSVASDISIGIGCVEKSDWVEWLMDISNEVDNISCKEGSLCWVVIHILGEYFMGYGHDLEWRKCVFCVVYYGNNRVVHVGAIFEVIGIEKFHVVGVAFDIIWPASGLDEGSAFVVAEVIDGADEISEMYWGVRV